jgi:hypothetical protein
LRGSTAAEARKQNKIGAATVDAFTKVGAQREGALLLLLKVMKMLQLLLLPRVPT